MCKFFCVNLIVLWVIFTSHCLAAESPESCIFEIGNAIHKADVKKFESLVDIDAIIYVAFDVFLREVKKQESVSNLPPTLALLFSYAADLGSSNVNMRKFLSSEVKSFVINGISSGSFAGVRTGSRDMGIISPLFADASIGKKEIRNIGKAMAVANGWLVPFSLYDFGNGHNYHIRGLVSKNSKGFRLVAIDNINVLVSKIFLEFSQINIGE